MSGVYRIFGSEMSPYSVKVRSYFRFKGIAHEWIARRAENDDDYRRYARLPPPPRSRGRAGPRVPCSLADADFAFRPRRACFAVGLPHPLPGRPAAFEVVTGRGLKSTWIGVHGPTECTRGVVVKLKRRTPLRSHQLRGITPSLSSRALRRK